MPKVAHHMIARAIAANVPLSFLAADSVHRTGKIEILLRKAGKGYVLGVASDYVFRSWAKQRPVAGTGSAIAQSLPQGLAPPVVARRSGWKSASIKVRGFRRARDEGRA
ncbi:SRSO17 transposase [Bradyrhizobium sp. F1.13.3]